VVTEWKLPLRSVEVWFSFLNGVGAWGGWLADGRATVQGDRVLLVRGDSYE
jgi:hypothetical protein